MKSDQQWTPMDSSKREDPVLSDGAPKQPSAELAKRFLV